MVRPGPSPCPARGSRAGRRRARRARHCVGAPDTARRARSRSSSSTGSATRRSRRSRSAAPSGSLRPSYGPTTNRRRALAELVRGAEVNARLGGVPTGQAADRRRTRPASIRTASMCIVVQLPPRGAADVERPAVPDRGDRHTASTGCSPRRRRTSPGLVSIVDIAPTALGTGIPATTLSWTPSSNASRPALHASATRSSRTTGSSSRSSSSSPGVLLLLALLGLRAAVTAVPAALLVNLAPRDRRRSRTRCCSVPRSRRERRSSRSRSRATAAASRRSSRSTAGWSRCTPTSWSRGRSGRRSTRSGRRRTRASGGSATRSRRCCSRRSSPARSSRDGASGSSASSSSASSGSS